MFAALIANIIDAFRSPRASARAMMARNPSFEDAALMVVLAFAVQGAAGTLVTAMVTGELSPFNPGLMIGELGMQMLSFGALTIGAHEIGAKVGGKATRRQIAGLVGWHSVVTAAFSPLQFLGVHAAISGQGGPLFLLAPLSVGVSIWLFAAFIAEAHRFSRIGPVIAATVAGFVFLGAVVALGIAIVFGPIGAPAG
ncbi:MAG: hypothetical protein ACJA1L_003758 [Paracoccaceae bacterium]